MPKKIQKTEAEWREMLTPEQYHVTREGGTEQSFTGCYFDTKTPGVYRCVCCKSELFRSGDKYDSGSGWPSFTKPSGEDTVITRLDARLAMERTEVEAMVLAGAGAAVGSMLGVIAIYVIGLIFPDFPVQPSIWWIAVSVLICLLAGSGFGLMPARWPRRSQWFLSAT